LGKRLVGLEPREEVNGLEAEGKISVADGLERGTLAEMRRTTSWEIIWQCFILFRRAQSTNNNDTRFPRGERTPVYSFVSGLRNWSTRLVVF
jgi:hypothetical protein